MKAKAKECTVSFSRLVLVAVNYGMWSTVDNKLQGIEEALHSVTRQLGGVRHTLTGAHPDETMLAAVTPCQAYVAQMLQDVERCTQVLDYVSNATHLADPYLGPMGGDKRYHIKDGSNDEAENRYTNHNQYRSKMIFQSNAIVELILAVK